MTDERVADFDRCKIQGLVRDHGQHETARDGTGQGGLIFPRDETGPRYIRLILQVGGVCGGVFV